MMRGSQKKMIVVRTHNSRMFEEAHFVMRHNTEPNETPSDILKEANRIIEGHLRSCGQEKIAKEVTRRRRQKWLWFLAGAVCGGSGVGGFVGLIWWLL